MSLKVFVSSTFRDLEEYRAQVIKALRTQADGSRHFQVSVARS